MSRESTCKIRMFFHEESQSGKAVRMVDKPRAADVRRFEWLPKSLLIHISKFPKGAGADYAEWEITIPNFSPSKKTWANSKCERDGVKTYRMDAE